MDKEKTRQYLIKLGCVLASFILWLYVYNFVNPSKSIKLSDVPVKIINKESLSQFNLIMIPGEKYTITLNLSGSTVDIDKVSRGDFKLVADLSGYGIRKGDINKIPVYIVKKPDNIQVTNSDMLYINIKTDNYIEKSLPVKIDIKGKPKNGYYSLPTSFNPANVTVSGTERYVNQVTAVYGTVNVTNSTSNVQGAVSLRAVDASGETVSNVSISPSTCNAVTEIKKVKTVGINVKTSGNLNKDIVLKSITPDHDKVEIAVDESRGNLDINSLDTVPLLLDSIDGDKSVSLKLVLPEGVRIVNGNDTVNVKVDVDVGKTIQKTLSQDIKINNLANNLNATLDKPQTSIVVSGEEDTINNLKNEDIDCSIDLTNINEEKEYSLKVTVKVPDGINLVSTTPDYIKVTIAKK